MELEEGLRRLLNLAPLQDQLGEVVLKGLVHNHGASTPRHRQRASDYAFDLLAVVAQPWPFQLPFIASDFSRSPLLTVMSS